jgi:hypothetical protein
MDWNAETETHVMQRIVALLISFAALSERASGRSYPVRCLVLWILRRAEVVARDWVDGMASDVPSAWPPYEVLHRNSRADAIHLAGVFRALAQRLKRQLRLEQKLVRRLMRSGTGSALSEPKRGLIGPEALVRLALELHDAMRRLSSLGFLAAPRLDTS